MALALSGKALMLAPTFSLIKKAKLAFFSLKLALTPYVEQSLLSYLLISHFGYMWLDPFILNTCDINTSVFPRHWYIGIQSLLLHISLIYSIEHKVVFKLTMHLISFHVLALQILYEEWKPIIHVVWLWWHVGDKPIIFNIFMWLIFNEVQVEQKKTWDWLKHKVL